MDDLTVTLTKVEREEIVAAIAFLCMHHRELRGQASNPIWVPDPKMRAKHVAHHTECLHQAGELAAKFGGRNAYPRAASPDPEPRP